MAEVKVDRKHILTAFMQQVLRRRFADTPIKQVVDASEREKITFACPICGDSMKKASKKRGNLYLNTNTYKCFNDGCMSYMSIRQFVSLFSRKYNITPDLTIYDYEKAKDLAAEQKAKSGNSFVKFLMAPKDNLISITEMINRFGLMRTDMLPEHSLVRKEIERRMLHHTPDYGDFFYADSLDNKIYIFNIGTRSGKVLGFSIRSIEEGSVKRYMIKDYIDIKNAFPELEIDKDTIEQCNQFNNYFNILNLNFGKPICLTEGQIDARFVDNCIATTGISKSMNIISSLGARKNLRILFDRDKAGRKEMIKLIQDGYRVFLWNMCIDTVKKLWRTEKDLKALVKIKDINDLYMYMAERRTIDYDSFNEFISHFFSTSPFDVMYI